MSDSTLVTTLVSAGVGAVVAFIGAFSASRLEFRRKIDETLRTSREQPYVELWKLTRAFQQSPRARITYATTKDFHESVADWYYTTGGWLLSRQAHDAYVGLQRVVAATLRSAASSNEPSDFDQNELRSKASVLRTELTVDLLSRSRAKRNRRVRPKTVVDQ